VESQKTLVQCYQKLRQGDSLGRNNSAYRITVRQLESLVRLSEALARLHCDDEVRPVYIREAFRLLKQSIIHVESDEVPLDDDAFEEGDRPNSGNSKKDAGSGDEGDEGSEPGVGEYDGGNGGGGDNDQMDNGENDENDNEENVPKKKVSERSGASVATKTR